MFSISFSHVASICRRISRGAAISGMGVIALASVSGCAILSGELDRAAKGAGKVVKQYCENVTVPEVREQVRAAVNKYAAPHSVAIECVDKSAPVLKSDDPESVAPGAPPASDDPSAANFNVRPIIIFEPESQPKPIPKSKPKPKSA